MKNRFEKRYNNTDEYSEEPMSASRTALIDKRKERRIKKPIEKPKVVKTEVDSFEKEYQAFINTLKLKQTKNNALNTIPHEKPAIKQSNNIENNIINEPIKNIWTKVND